MKFLEDSFLDIAFQVATSAHRYQYRKGSKLPYVIHPLEVAKRLYLWRIDQKVYENLFASALLHDVIEDTHLTEKEISEKLNPAVGRLVVEMTKEPDADKVAYMSSFDKKSIEALVLKLADRFVNVDDFIVSGKRDYAIKYFQKANEVYKQMYLREQELHNAFYEYTVKAIFNTYEFYVRKFKIKSVNEEKKENRSIGKTNFKD